MTDSPQGPYDKEQSWHAPPQPPYGMQQPGYGQPYGYGPPSGYRPQKTNTLAIVSLVTSLLWLCGAGSLAAIICGHLGLREIDRSGGTQTGRGMAIAGLVIGYLGLIAAVLYVSLVVFAVARDGGSDPLNGY